MKPASLIFFFLFSFLSTMLSGQYIPIVEEGKFWIYLIHWDEDHPAPVSGHAITFEGDTIINSLSYKKVYALGLAGEHNCQHPPCFQFDIPYQTTGKTLSSFIREDTVSKKVFILPALSSDNFCDTNEHLIFDYSLSIGDTVNSCIYEFIGASDNYPDRGIVDSIKVTERFGKNRNTIFTSGVARYGGLPFTEEVLIIEGVGLEYYGIYHEPLTYLVDYCEGGMEACGIISSNATIESPKEVNVFPNPTSGMFRISLEEDEIRSIRIYSAMGVLKNEIFKTNEIDLSHLAGGIYFLELVLENDERVVKRIVKEN